MSKKIYVVVNHYKPVEQLTEAEYLSLYGDESQRPYVLQLYKEEITSDSIPEDLRESVQTIVNNRIARWGLWKDLPANTHEVSELVEAVTTVNMTKGQVMAFIAALESLRAGATDNQALEAQYLYPSWKPDTAYTMADRLLYGDVLYRVLQDHTSQSDWTPDITPALYTVVEAVHTGTQADPIPYNGNMELVEGLYYTQDEVLYICTRSTGTPVYHALADLVGLYVEVVTTGGSNQEKA